MQHDPVWTRHIQVRYRNMWIRWVLWRIKRKKEGELLIAASLSGSGCSFLSRLNSSVKIWRAFCNLASCHGVLVTSVKSDESIWTVDCFLCFLCIKKRRKRKEVASGFLSALGLNFVSLSGSGEALAVMNEWCQNQETVLNNFCSFPNPTARHRLHAAIGQVCGGTSLSNPLFYLRTSFMLVFFTITSSYVSYLPSYFVSSFNP